MWVNSLGELGSSQVKTGESACRSSLRATVDPPRSRPRPRPPPLPLPLPLRPPLPLLCPTLSAVAVNASCVIVSVMLPLITMNPTIKN